MVINMNGMNVYAQGGVRNAAKNQLREEAKQDRKNIKERGPLVPRQELQQDDQCCICYEEM